MNNDTKKVFLKSFGCQMNVRDSEVICGLLTTNDYKLTTNPDEADIVIFNTCSVRQHAEDKVWSEIGKYKTKGPSLSLRTDQAQKKIIGLIGCMAQNYKEKVFERAPQVDFVVGPSDIHKIPEIIKSFTVKKRQSNRKEALGTVPIKRGQSLSGDGPFFLERKIWETEGGVRPEEIYHTGFYEDKEDAYVVISEGCSNYCSYCVVPYVRGEIRHRHHKDIVKEIEEAIDKGITKITLLGQNVCAYGAEYRRTPACRQAGSTENRDGVNFIRLLEMVDQIKGLKEFSFITSHPKDTAIDLFRAMADLGKLKKYLHLPVQSGSDRILRLMNRGYTRKFYLDLTHNYRKIVKGGALTTDIIMGFPSETEKDFQDTLDLAQEIQFDAAFIFKYSPRPQTEAAKMPDDVTRQEKERRHGMVLELQKKISKEVKSKK
jgi:tRNA-2-methylthio-N6-dimethylallyladenosine synthase